MAKVFAARGGQYELVSTFSINAADTVTNTSGVVQRVDANGVYDVVLLPAGAVVTGGDLVVYTASNDTTTLTASVGDSASAARYLAATSLKAVARTALTVTGFESDGGNVRVTIATATGDATAGRAVLRLHYTINNRQNESVTN